MPGGELLEQAIWSTNSYLNYGVIAEAYAYGGPLCVFVVLFGVTFVAYGLLHVVYGGLRDNCWAAFIIVTHMFTLPDADLSAVLQHLAGFGGAAYAFLRRASFHHAGAPRGRAHGPFVDVSHPCLTLVSPGRFHMGDLAQALQARGALVRFFTGYPYWLLRRPDLDTRRVTSIWPAQSLI